MNPWWVVPSMALGIAGAWLLYLASPQQLWRAAPVRAWPGLACALASLALLWPAMGAMAAVAMWLTLLMLVTTLAPFLGAWRARRREGVR